MLSTREQVASNSIYLVPAIESAVRVLHYLAQGDGPATLKGITDALNLPKSSCHNIVRTLQELRLLEYDPATRRYSLGLDLVRLGAAAANKTNYVAIARPYLEALAARTQLTAALAQYLPNGHIIIDKVESPRAVRVTIAVGYLHPRLTGGAYAKAFLATFPEDKLRSLLETQVALPSPPGPAVDEADYLRQVARARRDGYAASRGEFIEGVNAVVAPIFDWDQRPILAVGVIGIQPQLPESVLPEVGRLVKQAASSISNIICGVRSPDAQS